ncbi:hypothetical protein [Xanthocytophaga agilis]|uniref:Alginate export domain-containing protein n=1 Tax=Xanthocytophaga agilis TaxID=3048010 RepID=A0AAE3UEM5_9BACT|nr:hypothetical protein [Xanthocytophaga agilis]MDJ1499713.1 hypothetical protein [Xanthocytophaga agilis]
MKIVFFMLMLTFGIYPAIAQHEHHNMEGMKHDSTSHSQKDSSYTEHMHHEDMPVMTHSFSRNLPMNRNGSGTSWLPDATPMYAYMKHSGKWSYMIHGSVFLRQNWQNLNNNYIRGGKKFDAPNWFMGMAQREIGKKGLLSFHLMMSLDPLTLGNDGYPLLFQSGESYQGRPLIDRQHPHDLFSEVSVGYTHMINKDMDVFGYIGYPGEPAIGPTAFMHRISAFNNPDAPLSHHWQDATHIVFGVATVGLRYKMFKVEGSSFTGREPDEHRYDFDKPRFDSYSYRISMNPTANFALQFSQGWIKSPEQLHPSEDIKRTTASVIHSKMLNPNSHWTSSLVWGLNDAGGHHKEHSVLAESNLQLNRFATYGRYEFVQKSSEELGLDADAGDPLLADQRFSVHAITLGVSYTVYTFLHTNVNAGIQGSLYMPEKTLESIYGKTPFSAQVYIRLTPSLLMMNKHSMHH